MARSRDKREGARSLRVFHVVALSCFPGEPLPKKARIQEVGERPTSGKRGSCRLHVLCLHSLWRGFPAEDNEKWNYAVQACSSDPFEVQRAPPEAVLQASVGYLDKRGITARAVRH